MEQDTRSLEQYLKPRTLFRFLFFSVLGVFVFFVNVPFPAYQITIGPWQWGAVAAQSNVIVSHLTNLVKAALYTGNFPAMPFVVWGIGVYSIVDLFVLRPEKFWGTTRVAAAFAIFKIIGFLLLTCAIVDIYLGFHFGFMSWFFDPVSSLGGKSISVFIMSNILVTICISIPAASLFLPLLVDYGLVEFVGVLVRAVMRPVFKLPGRSAVISVSAFLGNFSVGHIAVNDQYKTGRMTEREAVVIGSSLSTVSVGFLLALATNTGLNNQALWGKSYWNQYFWLAFLVTLLVTLVGVRIFPLGKIPDNFCPGVEPNPEQPVKRQMFRAALTEALDQAQNQQDLGRRIAYIMKETIGVLGTVASGTAFFASFGVVLYTFTPVVTWLGYLFRPFFMLFGFSGAELEIASTGAMISFVEVTVPALLVTVGEWSMRLRFMLAVLPVSSIIFLASFVPCLMATDVPVKFWQLCLIWLGRMILSIVFAGIFAVLLFPAGMVA